MKPVAAPVATERPFFNGIGDGMSDRRETLLKAAYDLLAQCNERASIVDVLGMQVGYDDSENSGYDLANDIAAELGIVDLDGMDWGYDK